MKPQGIDRILLVAYAAMGALGLLGVGVCVAAPDVAVHMAQTARVYLTDALLLQLVCLVTVLCLIAWSAYVALIALGRAGAARNSVTMQAAEEGSVRVSARAVESLVRRAVGDVEGVLESKIAVVSQDGAVTVEIDMTAAIDMHVPEIVTQVQRGVKRIVEEYSGVPVRGVRVLVTDLRDNGPAALPPPTAQENAGPVLVVPEKVEPVHQENAGSGGDDHAGETQTTEH